MSTSSNDLDCARVHACQGMLFPQTPREVCEAIGLNWLSALRLSAAGWLGFNPESLQQLDESQETELRFVGALVVAGCDEGMLNQLLNHLRKPYCYRIERIFYDWSAQSWQLLPRPLENAEAVFGGWLDALEEEGDVPTLEDIRERATEVIERVQMSR